MTDEDRETLDQLLTVEQELGWTKTELFRTKQLNKDLHSQINDLDKIIGDLQQELSIKNKVLHKTRIELAKVYGKMPAEAINRLDEDLGTYEY